MTVRIGFIGCGLIARMHTRRLADVSDADIVAVHDVDPERQAKFAIDHDAVEVASADEVVEAADAVYVTTWTAAHPALVSLVVGAGKPIFCEKPLGIDLATAQAMTDEVTAAGLVNQVGLVLRHSPAFRWMQHQVQSGEFGPPMSMVFRDDQYIPVQGMYGSTWRGDVAKAGSGTLLEHSIHDLDLIEWIMGPITSVNCRTANFHGIDGIEDQATVILETATGAQATLSSTWHDILKRPSLRHVEAFCQGGYFGLEGDWVGPIARELPSADKEIWHGDDVIALAGELDGRGSNPDADFVHAVMTGSPSAPDFRTALRAHVLADAAYRSATAGGAPIEV
ncbi:MAG: Gfo/Idh/MocA family protein [Acidimicrobiales bacterium]